MNLRSFLRREQSNRHSKIECTVHIIHMYLLAVDPTNAFFETCVREISTEFEGQMPFKPMTMNGQQNGHPAGVLEALLLMGTKVEWKAKPNIVTEQFKQLLVQLVGI